MISDLINEIRENIDTLYYEHNLLVRVIQVSQLMYIQMQRDIFWMIEKKICKFRCKEPMEIDGIPVVINNGIGDYDYELVVSIPSYRFRKVDKN